MQRRRGAPRHWSRRKRQWLHPTPISAEEKKRRTRGSRVRGMGCWGEEGLLASWDHRVSTWQELSGHQILQTEYS